MGVKELEALVGRSQGKMVVVNVFATWCGPCREEIPALMAVRKAYPADLLLMVGVSADENMDALNSYIREVKLNYPVYLAQRDLLRWAGISAIPHMIIYGKDGVPLVNQAGMVDEEGLRDFLNEHMREEK
jgi:thiol-disulfide isomerase/thioredoxin